MSALKAKLEQVVNVVIVVVGIVFVCNFALGMYDRYHQPSLPYTVKAGDRIADTSALHLTNGPHTLVLVTSSHCHFCTESMEFYQALVSKARDAGVQVLAATAESPEVNREYLHSHGVLPDDVASLEKTGLRAPRTPTLVLIRSDGTVENSWRGKLDEVGQKTVMAAVMQK